MLDKSASHLVKSNSGVQVPDSPLDTGSSNWSYLMRQSFSEAGASRVNQLMPIINRLDTEALSSLSNSLCPAAKVERFEDFSPSEIGYPLPITCGKQANISNNVESEEPAEMSVLIKPKPKQCSSAAQHFEETMATKKARPPKVISSRIYRIKVAEAIKALKNAVPYSEIVLSQTRLNGETSAHSFVHIEGFGQYLLHPQTYHQPLEEMVGHLLKSNPQLANELLEHKGLAIVPMDSAYTILHNCLNPFSNSCQ